MLFKWTTLPAAGYLVFCPSLLNYSWESIFFARTVQDGSCQTSEILTNEAESQALNKTDVMVSYKHMANELMK